ncbi:MFS transporter [Corynebacterium gerontici]|uniref:Putative transporter n=1 Tax=Corynebacterium gerontici TaxID=2079234 RepID=A0A3G6J382_9CORY|nr:MFS transporter [Corynebacterium gerontici]AZA12392.1 putative transporter [Corynebacterium gerontici]
MSEAPALASTHSPARPRIFAATFVSEIAVGAHVGGVGALIALLAQDFQLPISHFAILGSFLGVGMVLFSLLSKWLMEATAGMVLKASSTMVILGALGLAFAPQANLAIISGLSVALGTSLVILIVPSVLAGPNRARDIALANGASSAASILSPLMYGLFASVPFLHGRWAALMLAIPAIYVMVTIRNVDFVHTPSAFAERRAGRKGKRRRDLADAFGKVRSVKAFGGPKNVADDELARAAVASSANSVHVSSFKDDHRLPKPNKQERRQVKIGLLRVALSLVAEFALYTWGVARLIDIGVPNATAATLGAVFPLGMAAGRLSAGVLIRWRFIFHASILGAMLGTIIIGTGQTLPVLVAGLLIAGAGNALLYPITVDDLVALPSLSPNRAAALSALAGGVVVFAMPLILAWLQHYLSLGQSLLLLFPVTLVLFLLPNGRRL